MSKPTYYKSWINRFRDLSQVAFCLATSIAAILPASAEDVQITADIASNTTWARTNIYFLDGYIYVLSGATLTIESGTVIKGLAQANITSGESASALIVTRGARILADGTAAQPIIFTAEDDDVNDPTDLGLFQRGLWGGVVILGQAPINTAADPTGNGATPKYDVFEGLPDTLIGAQNVNRYGGTDPADNSGILRYVSIRHGGFEFLPNKELNGLSLGCVGSGTVLEYIECYAFADDGFEFFGGTVNTKYLVSAFNDDDAFDTDQGFSGKNQFWFAIHENGRRDNGGELNGEPNTLAVSNAPLANFVIYNATWIGGGISGANTNANHGLTIREYAAPQIYNSILTDFRGNGVRITDVRSGSLLTNGLLDLRDNLFWQFASAVAGSGAGLLFSDATRNNLELDPLLRGISRTNDHQLDPRPAEGSPALGSSRTPPNDGFFSPVAYKGAFEGNNLWLRGWTQVDNAGFLSTNDPAPAGPQEIIATQDISANTTWARTNIYFLDGYIYVLSGATLTIESGTVIKGLAQANITSGESASALIVTRGARILADGTAAQPIIFTAEDDDVNDPTDLGLFQRGLWGGVVILGQAPINTAADPTGNGATPKYDVFEGLPDTLIGAQNVNRYGGTDPADNSGILRYVSIRHGGFEFLPNKELNGLSLGCVGSGTVLEYIECYAFADDGFEFFGGTVNTKYLVSAFNDDDAFDTDQGFSGKNQFWFAIHENGRRDNGGELNGEPNTLAVSNAPLANFVIYNATWIGGGISGANTNANHGLTIREYAAPQIYNSILTDFRGNGVRITDVRSGSLLTNGLLDLRDNLFWQFASAVAGSGAGLLFSDATRNNLELDPLLRGISRTNDHQLDPRPAEGSPALGSSRTPPNDGFFSPAAYKGAFGGETLWVSGWTFLSQGGFLPSGNGPAQPTLTASLAGASLRIGFSTEVGRTYQVQSRTDFGNGTWASDGAPIEGSGSPEIFNQDTGGTAKFYRVEVR